MLQCVAGCCSVLQCVAVQFEEGISMLSNFDTWLYSHFFGVAVRCSAIRQRYIVCCRALKCVAVCCRVLQGVAGCCSEIRQRYIVSNYKDKDI